MTIREQYNKKIVILLLLFGLLQSYAQIVNPSNYGNFVLDKVNKEITLHISKEFLIKQLGSSNKVVKLEADPLTITESGELTTIIYRCDDKNARGMLFGFFNDVVNEVGVSYTIYNFKNLNESQSLELMSKLDNLIDTHKDYLFENPRVNNIYFDHDDITFIIYYDNKIKMRLLWNGFDSEWESRSFQWANKKLSGKLND